MPHNTLIRLRRGTRWAGPFCLGHGVQHLIDSQKAIVIAVDINRPHCTDCTLQAGSRVQGKRQANARSCTTSYSVAVRADSFPSVTTIARSPTTRVYAHILSAGFRSAVPAGRREKEQDVCIC
jgi:hypothetical protein